MYQIAEYTSVNNYGTAVLLEALSSHPVEKLIVASSMSIYGEGLYRDAEGNTHPGCERTLEQLKMGDWEVKDDSGRPLIPQPTPESKPPALASVYALSKFDQERLCLILGRAYGIPTVALRSAVPEQPRRGRLGACGAHQREPVLLGSAQGQLMGAHLGALPGKRRDPSDQTEAALRGAIGGHELVNHQVEAGLLVADQDAQLQPAPEMRRRPRVHIAPLGLVTRVGEAEVDAHHVAQVAAVQLLSLRRADHVIGRCQHASEPDVLGVVPDSPEGMQTGQPC